MVPVLFGGSRRPQGYHGCLSGVVRTVSCRDCPRHSGAKDSREWTVEDIGKSLSEEALTAAVMPRYHIDVAVKRALGAKLSSLKDRAAS